MIAFALHDSTGRIEQVGAAPEFMLDLQGGPGLSLAVGAADLHRDYVKEGVITPRPACPAELAGHVLIGLPVPCTVYINRSAYPCDEPIVHLELPYAGRYSIRIESFPYLDAEFTLEKL